MLLVRVEAVLVTEVSGDGCVTGLGLTEGQVADV